MPFAVLILPQGVMEYSRFALSAPKHFGDGLLSRGFGVDGPSGFYAQNPSTIKLHPLLTTLESQGCTLEHEAGNTNVFRIA